MRARSKRSSRTRPDCIASPAMSAIPARSRPWWSRSRRKPASPTHWSTMPEPLFPAGSAMTGSGLVTGGSKGIGLGSARGCVSGGFATRVFARDGSGFEARKEDLPVLHCIACAVVDPGQVAAMVEQVTSQTGVPDILVNNAGAYLPGQVHDEE